MTRTRRFTAIALAGLLATAIVSGQEREWTTYSGDMLAQRHSPLTQITTDNVKNLELQWIFQARSLEKFEATPLVVDGVMYTVQPPNDVVALDAATGRVFWVYPYIPSPLARLCCGRVNRGLGIHENTLYMATIDGRLIALDAKTGGLVWNVAVGGARPDTGYSLTVAPLVIKDKVIIGTAGGEYGVRGFLAAFDAKSGREVWRFHTIPGPGEPGRETWAGESWKTGGGSIWVTGSYDADFNLTYWGVGNPGAGLERRCAAGRQPVQRLRRRARCGHRRAEVALPVHAARRLRLRLGADAGTRRHSVAGPAAEDDAVRATATASSTCSIVRPANISSASRSRRSRGRPGSMRRAGRRTWCRCPRTASLIYPGVQGGTNWYSPSFSPRTGLFYLPMWGDTFSTFTKRPVEYKEGQRFTGALPAMPIRLLTPGPAINRRRPEDGYGGIQAIDPRTGDKKWEYKMADVVDAGVLSTASDVLFSGSREGYAIALDARTGALLWKANVGGSSRERADVVFPRGPSIHRVYGRQLLVRVRAAAELTHARSSIAAVASRQRSRLVSWTDDSGVCRVARAGPDSQCRAALVVCPWKHAAW